MSYEPREHGFKLQENKEDENPFEEWVGFSQENIGSSHSRKREYNSMCYIAELVKGRGIWKNSLPQAAAYFKRIVAF